MHLINNLNVIHFLSDINKCQGSVYFETPEGDSLVLSSALSQYIFCSIVKEPEFIQRGEIRLAEPDDAKVLAEYLCE